MRRRAFIVGLGAAAWPLAAWAQQQPDRMRRIGVLATTAEGDREVRALITAFATQLRDLGWTEGKNVRIDYRWPGGDTTRNGPLAKELVELKPDVLFATNNTAAVVMRQYTLAIPIVFVQVGDAVAAGLVTNLARPEGNITGFDTFEYSIGGKWIEALRDVAPGLRRVAAFFDPGSAPWPLYVRAIEAAARPLGVQVIPSPVQTDTEIERAFAALATEPDGGVILVPTASVVSRRETIIALAAKHRLAAMYPYRFFAAEGGLMSYGSDLGVQYRQAASYVDRILKGAKPADLPVQQPTRFEFVLNLKTAKALGLTVPNTLLATADEVIQ
jgi:putative tryptophan/tyrosine transport system substrate-binding protein